MQELAGKYVLYQSWALIQDLEEQRSEHSMECSLFLCSRGPAVELAEDELSPASPDFQFL